MQQSVLGVLIAILVVLSMVVPAFASAEPGHTADCTYVKADPGSPCTFVAPPAHIHDAACGFEAEVKASPCNNECDHSSCAFVEKKDAKACTAKIVQTDICIPGVTIHTGPLCNYKQKKVGTDCDSWCRQLQVFGGHLQDCPTRTGAVACNGDCIAANNSKLMSTKPGHMSSCPFEAEIPAVPCSFKTSSNGDCRPDDTWVGWLHTGELCNAEPAVPGVVCDTPKCDHSGNCGYVAYKAEKPCNFVQPPAHVHDNACGYKAPVAGAPCNCKLGGVVTFTHRIPVSFKPERDSARAPNNTWFAFDYTLGRDSNYADTSFVTGGYGGGGYNNWGFGGRRAPGYGRGYGSSNGVASGYIEITAEAGNYVLTVTRVAIKGYTINPASITIRFTILENGKIRFNTYATRADFTYKRDDVVKKPAHNNPKTGDATNIALWSSMAVTSMAGVVVALKKRMFK